MPGSPSDAFGLLHPKVQKWVWDQKWTSFREVQERAIPLILDSDRRDVILASPTASGKTEAAFLPVVSRSAEDLSSSFRILYLSPLKALINDLAHRMESLFQALDAPLQRWHGDVDATQKERFRRTPRGGLLITPESIEALFIRRGPEAPAFFENVDAIIVDEIHAFIGTERGRQVQSLLRRIEDLALVSPVQLVGLSATLGDYEATQAFLRPTNPERVQTVELGGLGAAVDLVLRGYTERAKEPDAQEASGEPDGEAELPDAREGDLLEIADHLFTLLRGGRHLVFANSRTNVEQVSDQLRRQSERSKVPNEFFPHHGNLDRVIREEAEKRLRDGRRPTTIVATTTLELGIDVGDVASVAQVGPPGSVSSLRQRLGRSGRRGEAAVLRVFVQEEKLDPHSSVPTRLRASSLQSIAVIELLRERWYEPPIRGALHLSTLVQQVLSTVAQHGSISASGAWDHLCRKGPFQGVDPDLFARVLRSLGTRSLLSQLPTGQVIPGLEGERLLSRYDIYSAFLSPEEFRVVASGKNLGTLPMDLSLREGVTFIFTGRRWRISAIDLERKVLEVRPDPGGQAPVFITGGGVAIHERVRLSMRDLYQDFDIPPYLDSVAQVLLEEGRREARMLGLGQGEAAIIEEAEGLLAFPWTGDRESLTLGMLLSDLGIVTTHQGLFLRIVGASREVLCKGLEKIVSREPEPLTRTADRVLPLKKEKFHEYLDDELVQLDIASTHLDVEGARRAATRLLA